MLCPWVLSLLTVLANSFIPEIKSLDFIFLPKTGLAEVV